MRRAFFMVVQISACMLSSGAIACSCWYPTVEEHIRSTDSLFSGRVILVEGEQPDHSVCYQGAPGCNYGGTAHVAVDQTYKGPEADYQSVNFGWPDGSNCGWSFEEGEEVVIFASYGRTGQLWANMCSQAPYTRTNMAAEYQSHLAGIIERRHDLGERLALRLILGSHWMDPGIALVDYEKSLNDIRRAVDVYEQIWTESPEGIQVGDWRLERRSRARLLDAALLATQIGDYERARIFLDAIRDYGLTSGLSELLEAYAAYRIGSHSPIRDVRDREDLDRIEEGQRSYLDLSNFARGSELGPVPVRQAIMDGRSVTESAFAGASLQEFIIIGSQLHLARFNNAEIAGFLSSGSVFHRSDFHGTSILDAVISNSSFQYSDFSGATFKNTQITDSDFSRAILTDVEFSGTVLERVNFWYAALGGVDLVSPRMDDVDLHFARYDCRTRIPPRYRPTALDMIPVEHQCPGGVLIANFSNRLIDHMLDFSDADLTESKFVGTSFASETGQPISFENSILRGADFSLSGGYAVFSDADLTDADFSNADIRGFSFLARGENQAPATLAGVRFRGVTARLQNFYDFSNPLRSADLAAADLRGAVISCSFQGSSSDDGNEVEAMQEALRALNLVSRGAVAGEDCPSE